MKMTNLMSWGGGGGGRGSSRRSASGSAVPLVVSLLVLAWHSPPATAFGINAGTGSFAGLTGLAGTGTGTTTITAGNPLAATELMTSIFTLFQGGTLTTDITSGSIGGVAGSLALLAAALKAPLVALYQISAEVVVMVALILFISYIASLLGIDDFRRRSGLAADPYESESSTSRGYFSNFLESQMVQDITDRVYSAVENFDLQEFLERLDTRY